MGEDMKRKLICHFILDAMFVKIVPSLLYFDHCSLMQIISRILQSSVFIEGDVNARSTSIFPIFIHRQCQAQQAASAHTKVYSIFGSHPFEHENVTTVTTSRCLKTGSAVL